MATGREARMQQRMRGAQRHQVQDAEFDLFFDLPTGLDAIPAPLEPAGPAPPPPPAQPIPDQTTPSRSAKRRRLNSGGSASATSKAARTLDSRPSQEEVDESPLNAPGSGRRQSVITTAAAAGRTAALHQAVSDNGDIASPTSGKGSGKAKKKESSKKRTPKTMQRATHTRTALDNTNSPDDAPRRNDEPSPELSTMIQVPSSAADLGVANKAHINDDAADELSPAFVAQGAVDDITMSGMVPSSSPLARKSTASARAVPKRSSGGPATAATTTATTTRLVISETPLADRTQTMDESVLSVAPAASMGLSPDQPAPSTHQQRAGRSSQPRQASEVPSSSPVTHVAKRMLSHKKERARPKQSTIPTVEEVPEPEPEPGFEQEEEQEQAPQEEDENEEAEEIDAVEAARTIGKKRPRRSGVHEPSPELGSQSIEDEPAASPETRPNKKKRPRDQRDQRDQDQSPPPQSQPRPPKNSSGKASKAAKAAKASTSRQVSSAAAPTTKKQKKQRQQTHRRRDDGDDDDNDELEGGSGAGVERGSHSRGAPVPITVQRFAKIRMSAVRRSHSNGSGSDDGSDDDEDELAAAGNIPFASRSGVNAVDVLAQICEDIVEQKLQQLQEKHEQMCQQAAEERSDGGGGSASAMTAARKDVQAARRALESFQQDLRTRLLEQAVAVDTLHAMRQRVRAEHKEKLALREEILRIRAERDQVGLRMDALRSQHQQRVGQAMKATQMSATMFDIGLAVEQGRAAPELTPAQQKTAELANLELVVRRIASQVSGGCKASSGGSSGGGGGGTLHQIKEYNAFLERTAAVLEGRRLPARTVV